jgi:hypothetical protein
MHGYTTLFLPRDGRGGGDPWLEVHDEERDRWRTLLCRSAGGLFQGTSCMPDVRKAEGFG